MSEAYYRNEGFALDYTPEAAVTGGEVRQLADGRAGVCVVDIASGKLGAIQTAGVYRLPKTADIAILDGGKVYWDHSANKAHFKQVNDRDFYVGTAVGDAAASATTVDVNFNVEPRYKIDLARDPYLSALVGTAALNGFGYPYREGGALRFNITATSEAQKVDAMSVDGFSVNANAIVEGAFRMPNGGSGGASDFNIGVANGTHASDAGEIANSLFLHMDGGATAINAESDNVTAEVAATDTTKTFTAGTDVAKRVEFWMDLRNPADIQIYIDGVLVLPSSVFTLEGVTNTLFLLAHVEKSTGTETADMIVDWLRVRTAEQ